MISYERVKIFGISIDLFEKESLINCVVELVKSGQKSVIGNHNLHSVYLFFNKKEIRSFNKLCQYIFIDGMSLIILGKVLFKPMSRRNRLTYLDFIEDLLLVIKKNNFKVYHLGSKPENQELILQSFHKYLEQKNVQVNHGYFDKSKTSIKNQSILKSIKKFSPDILLVGMGMPIQEKWVVDNLSELPDTLIMNCGACMEYMAGIEKKPSRQSGRLGFEWLTRLVNNPGENVVPILG